MRVPIWRSNACASQRAQDVRISRARSSPSPRTTPSTASSLPGAARGRPNRKAGAIALASGTRRAPRASSGGTASSVGNQPDLNTRATRVVSPAGRVALDDVRHLLLAFLLDATEIQCAKQVIDE